MSSETEEGVAVADMVYDAVRRWYHVLTLAAVTVFMFWTRFQNRDAFTRGGDGFWLQAIDSWYHWRATNWTVENFPWALGYDPWTGFPQGSFAGQFGTPFDQLTATVAMILGLGDPGQQDVLMAVLLTVPALAALTAIPTYYVGKRVGNRIGGVVGVVFLSLTTGTFFGRTTAGQFDHPAAEVLLMTVAVLAMMAALTAAQRDRPIWELVVQRDWGSLRRSVVYSVLAGLALTLYIWTWPPGVVLVGIFGVFFVIQLTLDYYRGQSPDHVAFVGVVSMAVVVIGSAAQLQEPGFSPVSITYFTPIFAFLVGAGCAFLAWLARQWDARAIDRRAYPSAVGASVTGVLILLAIVLPGVFDTLVSNISGRLVPFNRSASALTVGEVEPPANPVDFLQREYEYAFFVGLLALPVLVFRSVLRQEQRAEHLLVAVWTLFLISMGLTQTRFNYYLVVGVAVLNAALVGFVLNGVEMPDSLDSLSLSDTSSTRAYQVAIALVLILVVVAPHAPPLASTTPLEAGENTGASPDAVTWEESNEWLANNTPKPGNYGGANNADTLDYDGTYELPAGDFDYTNGTYGVLSWWDYGHLITVQGNRIPHANPFQQNARSASAFLTAQNESEAELYLDAVAAGANPTHESDKQELREAVEENGDQPGIQYVMIDDESAAGKFAAITAWTGPDYREYVDSEQVQVSQNQSRTAPVGSEQYYNTMLARLYLQDANSLEHYRLIHENSRYSAVGFLGGSQRAIAVDNLLRGAQNGSWQTVQQGGLSRFYQTRQQIRQFEQIRGIDQSVPPISLGRQALADPHIESQVKIFERVEGATLAGETEPNVTVSATLPLGTATNRSFSYRQQTRSDDSGRFELTVPYPTEETLGPEDGYADSSVLSGDAEYTVTVRNESNAVIERVENVTVPERDIQNGNSIDVDPEAVDRGDNETDGTDGNQTDGTDGNQTDGTNGTEADRTGGNETDSTGATNGTDDTAAPSGVGTTATRTVAPATRPVG